MTLAWADLFPAGCCLVASERHPANRVGSCITGVERVRRKLSRYEDSENIRVIETVVAWGLPPRGRDRKGRTLRIPVLFLEDHYATVDDLHSPIKIATTSAWTVRLQ